MKTRRQAPRKFLAISAGHETPLPRHQGLPERVHKFDELSIGAVNAAIAAQRPLLVRGEPGVGKTQLAEAVAEELQRAFYSYTVDSRTESRDLLWRFDAVMRLAEAQLYATLNKKNATNDLAVRKFVFPGPLWWAFDAISAQTTSPDATPLKQGKNRERFPNGWVVLIDEIDKAESDVPNGLLEVLGAGQFTPLDHEPVSIPKGGVAPLILITTNEERVLPDAFVRRCLVLHLALPEKDEELITHLKQRGRAHFNEETTSDEVLEEAARLLVADRKFAKKEQLRPLPGQAEYLDLVRAVIELADTNVKKQQELIADVARFTLKKHPTMLGSVGERERS